MTTAGFAALADVELTSGVGASDVVGAACPVPDQSPTTAIKAVRNPSSWPPQVRIVATFYNADADRRTNLRVIKQQLVLNLGARELTRCK